jgi:hypothetical protein
MAIGMACGATVSLRHGQLHRVQVRQVRTDSHQPVAALDDPAVVPPVHAARAHCVAPAVGWHAAKRVLREGAGGNAAFSPDGRHLSTTGNNATVKIWKTDGTSDPLILDSFRATVQAIAPLDADRYVTAHDDGTIRTWRCPACGPTTNVLTSAEHHVTRQLETHSLRG